MTAPSASLPDEAGSTVFADAWRLWVRPEIARRVAAGEWLEGTEVVKFQVLMWGAPHSRRGRSEVRLNDEVRAIAKVRVNAAMEAGAVVTWGNIDDVSDIAPPDEGDDADAAHVTALRGGGHWWLAFRFRYNRQLSREHVRRGEEYVKAAGLALASGLIGPAIDNCASGMELIVKAERLQLPTAITRRNPHRHLAQWFSRWANDGNVQAEFAKLLHELNEARRSARYLETGQTPTRERIAEMIELAAEFAVAVQRRVDIPWTAEVDQQIRPTPRAS